MWTTGTAYILSRLTSSTLFAHHHHLGTIVASDHRAASTTSEQSSNTTADKNPGLLTRMRDLRARSPYALFIKDNYGEISAKHPNLKLGDISKKAAEIWKTLEDDKKQNYLKKFQDQKSNYDEEKKRLSANDLQIVDADEKSRRIQNRVKKSIQQLPTKKPRSAYAHFLSSLDRGEADLGDFIKGAAKRWTQLAAQDKQKFEDLHQEEHQTYVKALATWAASNNPVSTPTPRRSVSSASSLAKQVTKKKKRAASATGKSAAKQRTTKSSTEAVSAAKSTKTKASKATKDKEASSSDDEPPTRKTAGSSKS